MSFTTTSTTTSNPPGYHDARSFVYKGLGDKTLAMSWKEDQNLEVSSERVLDRDSVTHFVNDNRTEASTWLQGSGWDVKKDRYMPAVVDLIYAFKLTADESNRACVQKLDKAFRKKLQRYLKGGRKGMRAHMDSRTATLDRSDTQGGMAFLNSATAWIQQECEYQQVSTHCLKQAYGKLRKSGGRFAEWSPAGEGQTWETFLSAHRPVQTAVRQRDFALEVLSQFSEWDPSGIEALMMVLNEDDSVIVKPFDQSPTEQSAP